jgi:hypothetical protein
MPCTLVVVKLWHRIQWWAFLGRLSSQTTVHSLMRVFVGVRSGRCEYVVGGVGFSKAPMEINIIN